MMKHEQKPCPRCGIAIECKVGSIALCQCSAVKLDDPERSYIQQQYADCLCAKCLVEMKNHYHQQAFRQKLKKLISIFRY